MASYVSSNPSLETCEAASLKDLTFSPVMQLPVDLNMEFLNMFPVAELSDLNNTDLSFLDDICISEDNHLTEIKDMSDFDSVEGCALPELQTLSADWLSGNIGLDSLTESQNFPESIQPDHVYNPCISNSSFANPLEVFVESPPDNVELEAVSNNPFFAESLSSEERIYSSSDELASKQTDINPASSPLVSETGEVIECSSQGDDYSVAGKKYLKMRHKNNIASQRSRKLRKQKNTEMAERLKNLEKENKELSKLAAELEKQRDNLQRQLLQIISKKK